MEKVNKPKHLVALTILGCILMGLSVASLVAGILMVTNGTHTGGIFIVLFVFLLTVGGSCLFYGLRPEVARLKVQTDRYIQQSNKGDLTELAETTAEINKGAVKTTARAVKEGFEEETMFCKHCGATIDADSKFCNKCGKEQ